MKLPGKRKRGTNSLWEERSNTWEWWLVVICGPWTNEKVEDVKKGPRDNGFAVGAMWKKWMHGKEMNWWNIKDVTNVEVVGIWKRNHCITIKMDLLLAEMILRMLMMDDELNVFEWLGGKHYSKWHNVFVQGSQLLHKLEGSLLFKYSNFQQIYKKLSQFYKKLRTGLIRLKVASNPTLPKGQKPKWHLTTKDTINCQGQ